MAWKISDRELNALIGEMSLDEKIALVSGNGLWRTAANYRLNVPELLMTDGTYGVRYSVEQIDAVQDDDSQLAAFLSVVNTDLSNKVENAFGSTRPATCFPNGSSFACSWDMALARELGEALAVECQAFGVNVLLGPGVNIRRTPLAGRSYEYYSEDPFLTGEIASAVINGLQAKGVGAALKHFACNNSEVQRTTMSSEVDERALREIYLSGFERAIRKSSPWTVMSSYNRLNGVQAAENRWLLTDVLREEWGYDGVVVSDWHGIKDRPASLNAGNDLDMPESGARKQELKLAVEEGRVTMKTLDQSCRRVLELTRKARNGVQPGLEVDYAKHHALSRRMASESIVLLKNRDDLLPLDHHVPTRIVVIGTGAVEPTIQGSGCATTRPTDVDIPLSEIRRLVPTSDVRFHPFDDFVAGSPAEQRAHADVERAEAVLFFANTSVGADGEGSDRATLNLDGDQDDLIKRLAKINPNIAVVLACPDAVVMPWLGEVRAVVAAFFGGQGVGSAIVDVLFGKQNPCAKLTVTFPERMEHIPGFLTYPGENNRHVYSEGLHVGYRFFDGRNLEPLFPFGFGLSYTTFAYSDVAIDISQIDVDTTARISFDLTNAGPVAGKEIAQIYFRPHHTRLSRPLRELKGFAKVELSPGETRRVEIAIDGRDLRYYDPVLRTWLLDAGTASIEVGASSRDIRLEADIVVQAPALPLTLFDVDTQPFLVLEHGYARKRFRAFIKGKLDLDDDEAERMVNYCASSFLGIYNTVSWVAGEKITKNEMADFFADLNQQLSAATVNSG